MTGSPVVAFFSTQARCGQTSLVYHLACVLADLGKNILVVDLDPQGDLSLQLDSRDVVGYLKEIKDIQPSSKLFEALSFPGRDLLYHSDQGVAAIASSDELFLQEESLSRAWANSAPDALEQLSLCWRNLHTLSRRDRPFDLILLDTPHYPGAITKTALLAADSIVLPVQLRARPEEHLRVSLGLLQSWQQMWREKTATVNPKDALDLAPGGYNACGYVVTQGPQTSRVQVNPALLREKLAGAYNEPVLGTHSPGELAVVRHFGELQALSREARKPMFSLKAADGAVGSHARSVLRARETYEALAQRLWQQLGLPESNE